MTQNNRHPATISGYKLVIFKLTGDDTTDQNLQEAVTQFDHAVQQTGGHSVTSIMRQHNRQPYETLVIGDSDQDKRATLKTGAAFIYTAAFLAADNANLESEPDNTDTEQLIPVTVEDTPAA